MEEWRVRPRLTQIIFSQIRFDDDEFFIPINQIRSVLTMFSRTSLLAVERHEF